MDMRPRATRIERKTKKHKNLIKEIESNKLTSNPFLVRRLEDHGLIERNTISHLHQSRFLLDDNFCMFDNHVRRRRRRVHGQLIDLCNYLCISNCFCILSFTILAPLYNQSFTILKLIFLNRFILISVKFYLSTSFY